MTRPSTFYDVSCQFQMFEDVDGGREVPVKKPYTRAAPANGRNSTPVMKPQPATAVATPAYPVNSMMTSGSGSWGTGRSDA
ncbi:hypothetical protein HDV00_002538 [Rhizophlyctis rosea]|nr:hypothetical protein HDV00_002538 [Rhizophlyctis rosea]